MGEERPAYELTLHHQELTPGVWGMLEQLALASYQSRSFGMKSQGEAAMKMLFCYENRLPLSAANTGLYAVNGKLAVMSNIIAAQVRRHPDYDYQIKTLTDAECTIIFLRRNGDGQMHPAGESTFTIDDAKRAGLASKDNWKNYPRNLLFARAISNGQRWFAPDVFSQPVYVPEELGMTTDGDGNVIEGEAAVIEEPRLTLEAVLDRFSAEDVLIANEGRVPETQAEIDRVWKKLTAPNPDDAILHTPKPDPEKGRMYK